MDNDLTTLITVDELCELLMIGRNAAYQLLNSGKIKCFRINRIWKFLRMILMGGVLKEKSGEDFR